MIKTVPIDLSLNLIIGLVLAGLAADYLQLPGIGVFNKALVWTILYGLLVFVPIGAVLFLFWPDWSLMYFLDPEQLPRHLSLTFALIAYQLALISGFFIGQLLVTNRRLETLILLIKANIAMLVFFSAMTLDRIFNVGSYDAFHSSDGSLALFYRSSLCYAFIPITLYFVVPLIYTGKKIKNLAVSTGDSAPKKFQPAEKLSD